MVNRAVFFADLTPRQVADVWYALRDRGHLTGVTWTDEDVLVAETDEAAGWVCLVREELGIPPPTGDTTYWRSSVGLWEAAKNVFFGAA